MNSKLVKSVIAIAVLLLVTDINSLLGADVKVSKRFLGL